MARRRLNKKVALIGSTVFLLVVLAAVFVIMRLNRDPAPFVADGDAAWAAKDYKGARDNYARAYGLTRSSEGRIDLLFKLAEAYRQQGQWDKVMSCWGQIVTMDSQNVRARLAQLKYCHILADSLSHARQGMSGSWEEVRTLASGAIETVEQAGLLNEERKGWELSFGLARPSGWDLGPSHLGAHLHFVKGQAAFELASMGAATSPGDLLEEARGDLQRACELDPGNARAYRYLAEVYLEKGQIAASRGSLEEKAAAERSADDVLADGKRAAGETPEAYIHPLTRKLRVAQQGGIAMVREKMEALEPEYVGLTERFPSSAPAEAALAQFYSLYAAFLPLEEGAGKLDRAIRSAERACTLDGASTEYPLYAASYYYRRFSIYGDPMAIGQAIELGGKALELPDTQDRPGPTQFARRINRFSVCSLLAKCCVERLLSLPDGDPTRRDLLTRTEGIVHEIGQIQGSGENPQVLKWQGMLELVKGETGMAIRNLHAAYEQIKAASTPEEQDPFLSYTLAKMFEETSEVGAVVEFLGTALTAGIVHTKPTALLDYADALLRVGTADAVEGVLSVVSSFDERFGGSDRSRFLRVGALIVGGYITEAEEEIVQLPSADPHTIELKLDLIRAKAGQLLAAIHRGESAGKSPIAFRPADGRPLDAEAIRAMRGELAGYYRREADLVGQSLQTASETIEDKDVARLCESLIGQGLLDAARTVVEAVLKKSPDSVAGLFYRGLLSEPAPSGCSEARRREIQEEALGRISDPIRRSLELGSFYRETGRHDEAAAEWRRVLDATASQHAPTVPAYLRTRPLDPRHVAVSHLFDLARQQEDWGLAEGIVKTVERDNLDDCSGHLFAARLAFAKADYNGALTHLDECLRQRPIFSYGYMLRGNVEAALGREGESVADIRRAAGLNPTDPLVAKALANAVHVRNRKLGGKLSSEQERETRKVLERAITLNPRDVSLLSAYADFLSERDSLRALAMRQTIQINAPSLGNAVMLGRLATTVALRQTEEARKQALFQIAETAFRQAQQIDPTNQFMLESYAEYFRVCGKTEQARQLLLESNDDRLLWRHDLRTGRYEEAKEILEKMVADGENRVDALKGLVLVAEETSDRDAVRKYSEELLALEDSVVNRLAQLQAYLDVGLVSEAEHRLHSFKEKYPGEPRALLMEALVAKRQGRLDEALELTNRNLAGNQENASVWRLRGEISFLMGNYDQAVSDLRRSRTLDDNPVTTVVLAKAHLWAGRDEEAIDELQRARQHAEAPLEASTLLEATYRRLGRSELLERFYAETLATFPKSVFWLNRAGAFALDQGQCDQGEQLYEKACRLQQQAGAGLPTSQSSWDVQYAAALDGYLRALVLAVGDSTGPTGHPEKLDRILQEGRKYADTAYAALAFFRMAEAYKKSGDVEAALDYCRRAVEKAWASERLAVEVLLRVYMMMGGQEVSKFCRERLDKDPDSLAANFTMFNLAKIENDYGDAITYIDTCIRLAGPDSEQGLDYLIKKAQLLTVAHKATSDNGYLRKAVVVYESLHEKMPKNSSVLNNLAYMLALSDQRLTEALEYARKAVEQEPDEANYLDTYAYVLHRNGRNAEAAESIAAAIQQYEVKAAAPAEVYEHLGMVSEALGERDKALAAYRRALEMGADTPSGGARERIRAAIDRLGR